MKDKIILSVKGIVKQFPGTLALNNVDVVVHEGEAHALVGENGAGKSTLMNIIAGVYQANKGTVEFLGKEVKFHNTKEAQDSGIGFVHQELNLCKHLKVAENIFMGRMPKNSMGFINQKELFNRAKELLNKFNADFSPNELVSNLTVAQSQIVEIAKALSLDCKLLILDEPTSSLTEQETKVLFSIVKEIKKNGISILYISHRMEEIFEVCDSLTVLRDGNVVKRVNIDEVNTDQIIQMMVGREIKNLYPPKSSKIGDVFFEVQNFTHPGVFQNINFKVRKGEILGFYGLVGAGRSEVMRSICGVDPHTSGKLFLEGKEVRFNQYEDAISHGVGYITEDRKAQGLFLHMTIMENMSAANLQHVSHGAFIQKSTEKELSEKYVDMLNIKISSVKEDVNDLSGGNQQKVMIGKWLSIEPKLLILDEPTRGIDVGAKSEIHKLLRNLCESGVCVVVISSELPEIIGMSDRIIVMHEGVISGEVSGKETTEENIIMYASSSESAQAAM